MADDTATITVARDTREEGWADARVVDRWMPVAGIHHVELAVRDWPGHRAGQHVKVRVSTPDGWSSARSFSIVNAPESTDRVHLMLQEFADGDVTHRLADPGPDMRVQVMGPRGDRLTWAPGETDGRPLLLIAGGTGIVPLMSIARLWVQAGGEPELRVISSVRSLDRQLFADELAALNTHDLAEAATIVTGAAEGSHLSRRGTGRLSAIDLELFGVAPERRPECFVCGPDPFVESVTRMLVQTKHDAARIRTEWFVPVGDE